MKEFSIVAPVKSLSYDELSDADRVLVDAAREATHRSYAPYSKFCVGAAIALSNGEIVTGSNQENAAYPSGTCAERTAAFYAHSRYPEALFSTIAIAARDTNGSEIATPISPCGACRQALLEYETLAMKASAEPAQGHVRVILVSSRDIYILPSIRSLLPLAFTEFI